MSRRKKKPHFDRAITPDPKKEAKTTPTESFDKLPVRWCFRFFDNVSWHGERYTGDSFNQIGKHLKDYQGLSWADIKKKDHPVKIYKLIHNAKKRLQEKKQDDIDELWRLQLTGLQRLWGIRFEDTFRVLWWDPEHCICPSAKKHT